MEGPDAVSYGSVPAALAASAAAIDAHTAELAALPAVAAGIVPLGGIIAFRTQAELTAAGAGWARETSLDGRILLGAGTAGGQTFTEATNYGTTWVVTFTSANNSPASGAVQSGGGSTSVPTHTHTTDVTMIPPARAVVWGRRS